jgi:hypothetical protein
MDTVAVVLGLLISVDLGPLGGSNGFFLDTGSLLTLLITAFLQLTGFCIAIVGGSLVHFALTKTSDESARR